MDKKKKTMVYFHNGILCSRMKEGAHTLSHSLGGPEEHYVKLNKLGGERRIRYDLMYN